ncbi:DUF4124 domain-containing protein [Solemya velum gill symbiont]|uniref:DUF4124 domain-containing protein n=1 Tax=Solemya velum gill symbiont TaxID=2340 RepID=UPI00117A9E9A|nr:DUF4124 domain-containing protein [Solemya velum gill symbiont]
MNKVFLFFLLLLCMPVTAEVYTWIGADGNRHYGDRPPEAGAKAATVPESVYASPKVGWVNGVSRRPRYLMSRRELPMDITTAWKFSGR